MHIKIRRFIYIITIIIFFVAAGLIIFYTSGYRFDIYQKTIKKTGSLFITTKPNEAKLYINDELVDEETPTRINQLTPNIYSIRIEKEGFQNWHKKIEIKAQQTSVADNIILWPESPKTETLIEDEIKTFSIDPQERFILFQNSEGIRQYHIATKKITDVINIKTSENFQFKWADNGQYVLLSKDNKHWIYTIDTKIDEFIPNTSDKIKNLKFHPENPSILTYTSENTLCLLYTSPSPRDPE